MKKLARNMLVVLSVLLLSASLAQASSYVIGKLGTYFPEDSAYESGFGLRGAYGMSFRDLGFGRDPRPGSLLDKLLVEVGVGVYTADVDAAGQSGDITVMPVTVSGVFVHRLPNLPVDLRAAVGLGTYFTEIDTTFEDDSSVEQGLYLNAGAIYHLNEQFGVLVDIDFDNADADVGGWMLNAGIVYRP